MLSPKVVFASAVRWIFISEKNGIVLIPTWSFSLENGPGGTKAFCRKSNYGEVNVLKCRNVLVQTHIYCVVYIVYVVDKILHSVTLIHADQDGFVMGIYFLVLWTSLMGDSEDNMDITII